MIRPLLTIVTPCTRPGNLPAMNEGINAGRDLFEITWYVVFDALQVPPAVFTSKKCGDRIFSVVAEGSRVGNAQRNSALDKIKGGWVYFLDDDNVLHPELMPVMHASIQAQPWAKAFVFPQIGNQSSHTAEARAEHMRVNYIDTAQIFWQRQIIGDARFEPVSAYHADGLFVEEVGRQHAGFEGFVFLDRPLCYYNALRQAPEVRKV